MAEKIIKSKKMFMITLGALVAVMIAYFTFRQRAVIVDVVTVKRGVFESYLEADAIIRTKDRYTVPAFADGDLRRVDLKVGDPVNKGQSLAQLIWDVRVQSVRSPISGVISKVYRESAGPIRRGDPIVEVVDPKNLEMMAELLTTDATQVQQGDAFLIRNWGGPEELHGRIARVSRAGYSKVSALGVEEERTEVTGELKNLPLDLLERLGSNFHVDVKILLDRSENALILPAGAIFRVGSEWAVYRVENDRAREARIRILSRNNEEVLIGQGLTEGDRVVNFPGDLLKEGVRITAKVEEKSRRK
jgi:HlyD family secretion protein